MKGRYLLIVLLVFSAIMSFIGLKFSFDNYLNVGNSLTSYASSDEGNISFFVESGAGGGTTGGTTGGGTTGGAGGGGGGGGGVFLTGTPDFSVEPESLNVQAVSGRVDSKEIVVENIGTRTLTIDVYVTGLEDLIGLDSNKFTLKPGEKK